MNTTSKRTGAVLTAAAMITTAAATSAGASTPIPRCDPGHLAVTLSSPQIAAGNTGYVITETNDWRTSCTVGGWPHLRLWLHRHHKDYRVDAIVTHGSTQFAADPGSTVNVINPGHSVTASISFGSTGGAQSVLAVGLIVRNRGALWGLPVAFTGGTSDVDQARLTVTAWSAQ